MAVSKSEFDTLKKENLSARIVTTRRDEITGVEVRVKGVNSAGSLRRECWFTVFLDVEAIRSEYIPDAYIKEPGLGSIQRANILQPEFCEKLGKAYPIICWGHGTKNGFDGIWRDLKPYERSLLGLFNLLKELLNS